MPKYLVACDLDDTLLTKDKKITNKTLRFIKKFTQVCQLIFNIFQTQRLFIYLYIICRFFIAFSFKICYN